VRFRYIYSTNFQLHSFCERSSPPKQLSKKKKLHRQVEVDIGLRGLIGVFGFVRKKISLTRARARIVNIYLVRFVRLVGCLEAP